ncbi:tRNA (adenosine(37)-N6)-threonylcarbamoyltransferase complex ATPase subunit type 1 TsaE [Pseudokordiimonas caeni]|uniref:tRNA (adenosine(37)-N6)-threonylcarbamoyltransferase complex ATPase subunit type 1 TsaE n=1 Tax=Pseudokordiimonas caeni TaxID=2997908 RepID=UPI002810AC18|nr:tRNA (adenosine(37)-N6)-threonylcarbamoyltransferase complex ATPase subunit type 1 TsaE [Pseudokordiimonas caeni]
MMTPFLQFEAIDEAAMQALARRLAGLVGAGDLIALAGDLGAGKSTFARALVRALLKDDEAEVPSPTFTLVQGYEPEGAPTVYHADLYRLKDPEEIYDLGLEDARDEALLLIEWPDRLPAGWLDDALVLRLTLPEGGARGTRQLEFYGAPRWGVRLEGLAA